MNKYLRILIGEDEQRIKEVIVYTHLQKIFSSKCYKSEDIRDVIKSVVSGLGKNPSTMEEIMDKWELDTFAPTKIELNLAYGTLGHSISGIRKQTGSAYAQVKDDITKRRILQKPFIRADMVSCINGLYSWIIKFRTQFGLCVPE